MYHTFQTIIIPGALAFIVTLVGTRFLMAYLYGAGIIAEDSNKEHPKKLASSGGLAVAVGIMVGMLSYTFGGSFNLYSPLINLNDLLAIALSIILIALVGFLDDVNVKANPVKSTDRMDVREGLKQWQKPLLTLLGALPIMAVNAGTSIITVPVIGSLNLGIVYPLIIIPLAVIFVSNSVNLLGGFDGLQPGMMLIASFAFLLYSIIYGTYTGTLLSAVLFASVLAFMPFNMYKARIIPGDSFTYATGATLVAIMVMGNMEVFGAVVFFPYIIEFFLHLRRRFKVNDLGIRQKDGTFKSPYGKKIYSLTHLAMSTGRRTEQQISYCIWGIGLAFVILAFALKFLGFL